jgi:hypothetical protein
VFEHKPLIHTYNGGYIINLRIDQKSITRRDGQLVSMAGKINLFEGSEGTAKKLHRLLPPDLIQALSHTLCQLLVAALLGKSYLIKRANAVKLEELIIYPGIQVIRPLGNHPGNVSENAGDTHISGNGYPLVALLHIKASAIFINLDGIPDPLLKLGIIEVGPLQCKFTVLLKYRHKIPGKGIAPAGSLGAYYLIGGYLEKAHMLLISNVIGRDHIIKSRKIRILPPSS